MEVAGYIGTRTKEECEKHYYTVFLGVGLDGKELLPEKGVTQADHGGDMVMGAQDGLKRKREFMPVCQIALLGKVARS
jgi:transcriptional adapter 2-alpha